MRFSRTILVGLSTALLVPTAAFAQTCRSAPPLAGNSRFNVGAAAHLFDGGNTIGGSVTAGSTFFVSGAGAYTAYDIAGLSLKAVGGSVGYEVQALESRMSICPTMSVSYGFGLEDLDVDVSSLAFTPAVAVSWLVDLEPTVKVVPAIELALTRESITGDAGSAGSNTLRDTYGSLLTTLGFQIRERWAIAPSIQFPFAASGGSAVFGISLTFAPGGGS